MSLNRRQLLASSAAAAAAMAIATVSLPAHAQSFPNKPLKIIVPYPPGGSSDIIARAISQPLSDSLGQPVIVENRPGASGNLGADLVANGTPAALIARLNAELIKAIRSPDVRARLTGQGAEVVTMQSAEQDRFFDAERKRWGAVVAEANIKLD